MDCVVLVVVLCRTTPVVWRTVCKTIIGMDEAYVTCVVCVN